jgi:cytochrome b
MSKRILVWDVPTRVFHWLLVLSFSGAYLTAESERYRDIHVLLGYTMLGLLTFRLMWGFVRTRYARFSSFVFKPAEIFAYIFTLIKGKPTHFTGHNPAGSLAIWLLLSLGIATGISGVLIFQDIGGDVMEEMHELFSNGMLAVVFIHIGGVVVSSLMHRENLVRSMITGFKTATPNEAIKRSYLWLGGIILAAVIALWVYYPATGMITPSTISVHSENHDKD